MVPDMIKCAEKSQCLKGSLPSEQGQTLSTGVARIFVWGAPGRYHPVAVLPPWVQGWGGGVAEMSVVSQGGTNSGKGGGVVAEFVSGSCRNE